MDQSIRISGNSIVITLPRGASAEDLRAVLQEVQARIDFANKMTGQDIRCGEFVAECPECGRDFEVDADDLDVSLGLLKLHRCE